MDRIRLLMTDTKGLTLVATMMLLFVMSMVGVVSVNMAVQESKIAKNYQDTRETLTWAEAGIEAARQVLMSSDSPELYAFKCTPGDPNTFHYYPDSVSRKVTYCINLITMEMEGDTSSERGSSQDPSKGKKTYYYKLNASVTRTASNGDLITLREIQSVEQQTRYSL